VTAGIDGSRDRHGEVGFTVHESQIEEQPA